MPGKAELTEKTRSRLEPGLAESAGLMPKSAQKVLSYSEIMDIARRIEGYKYILAAVLPYYGV